MGAYTSIRGWIGVHEKALPAIQAILKRHVDQAVDFGLTREDAKFYNRGWVLPADHINLTHYIFYGADIRTEFVKFIGSQLTEISALLMRDDEIDEDWGMYPTGRMDVEEDGSYGYPNEEWLIGEGVLVRRGAAIGQVDAADSPVVGP